MLRNILGIVLFLTVLVGCKSSSPEVVNDPPPRQARPAGFGRPSVETQVAKFYVDACTELIRGDYQEAMAGYRAVLELDPDHHASKYNISRLLLDLRQYEEATLKGKEAVEADPENYWYYKNLLQAYEFTGNYKSAITLQEEVVRRFPSKTKESMVLVDLLARNDQANKALVILENLSESGEQTKEILTKKLEIEERSNSWSSALKTVDMLINKYPDESRFLEKKVDILESLNRNDEAIAILEQIVANQPENGYSALKLADYYKKKGNIAKSDEYLYIAFANPSIEPEGKLNIITQLLQYADKESEEVIPRAKKLAEIFQQTHPGSAKADLLQAKILAFEGSIDKARMKYLSGLEESSTDINLWNELLELDQKSADMIWLYNDAEEALTYYPNQKRILYFYGLSSTLLGKWEEAKYALKKAQRLQSANPILNQQINICSRFMNFAQGESSEEDKSILKGLLSKNPSMVNALFLGRFHMKQGDQGLALQTFEKAQKKYQAIFPAHLRLLIESNKLDEAQQLLNQSTIKESSPIFLEINGDLLFSQGKQEEAEEKWKAAIQAGATDLNIRQKTKQ
ncbi:MAG: tetratricopeptide repeat protein [Bacteroidota bacterium]